MLYPRIESIGERMRRFALILILSFAPSLARADFALAARSYSHEQYDDALKQFKSLAEHGDANSQYFLGQMYEFGRGVAKDDAQAALWYRKSAVQGHARAQNALATMFMYGRGVPQDRALASLWYRAAADQGLAEAQYNLGMEYVLDRPQRIVWLRKAAVQGDPMHQFALATEYGYADGHRKDAALWMHKAADQGLGIAQAYLGRYYLQGIGVQKDVQLALRWLELGYRQGSSDAAFDIATLYDVGMPTVARDIARAVDWYCKAADIDARDSSGSDNAMYRLRSIGALGYPCLLRVANQGSATAQWIIGREVESQGDPAQAAQWYRKSAEQIKGFAIGELSRLYATGSGVPHDPVIAQMLYELSDVWGFTNPLREPLTPEQKAEAQALAAAWKTGTPLPSTSRTGHSKESTP
jgi:uncharacterized protein